MADCFAGLSDFEGECRMKFDVTKIRTIKPFYVTIAATLLSAVLLVGSTSVVFGQSAQSYQMNAKDAPKNAVWLDTLAIDMMYQDYKKPLAGKSVEGNPMTLMGVVYPHGVGTHAWSEMEIELNGCATMFISTVGIDDEIKDHGSVRFKVFADGKIAADSGIMKPGDTPKTISADLKGAKRMNLIVTDADDNNDSDHSDWAGAMLFLDPKSKAKPRPVKIDTGETLKIAHINPTVTSINGPRIVGTTPGRDFLFLIPATGEGPLTYSAENLPAGLSLDSKTGIISGSLKSAGTYQVNLTVKGPKGTAKRKLTIVGGDHKLALTPPMGWNSWNVWAGAIDDAKVRQAADWMVKSGLAAHGYQYINIDDCWEGSRDANGEITTNEKFPDMKALADYVHSKGLKLGIYSSPGTKTCAGFEGSYQHEAQDAKTYAKWGIDYIKYDWCSYYWIAKEQGDTLAVQKKPYQVMRSALDQCNRDIVYSLCQYGMGDVWKWGEEIGGNCWRTTGDIGDVWSSMSGIGFAEDGHEKYAGPGHWNDPDMLVVGTLGWGSNPRPCNLTKNEQITHITLWSLISAPMLLGCDLSQFDQFTSDLMSNDEVIAVNQDPLGKPAGRCVKDGSIEIWARPLSDGTMAVGIFNRGYRMVNATAKWSDLGLAGAQPVRDLWQKKDLGDAKDAFTAKIPGHGALLIKVGKPKSAD